MIRRELYCRSTLRVVHPELALCIEKQVTGIGRPFIRGHVVTSDALFLALVFYLAEWRRKRLQLDFADQNLPLAGGRIHVPQLAMLSRVISLHELYLLIIWTSLVRFRRPSGHSALC